MSELKSRYGEEDTVVTDHLEIFPEQFGKDIKQFAEAGTQTEMGLLNMKVMAMNVAEAGVQATPQWNLEAPTFAPQSLANCLTATAVEQEKDDKTASEDSDTSDSNGIGESLVPEEAYVKQVVQAEVSQEEEEDEEEETSTDSDKQEGENQHEEDEGSRLCPHGRRFDDACFPCYRRHLGPPPGKGKSLGKGRVGPKGKGKQKDKSKGKAGKGKKKVALADPQEGG